MPGLLSSKDRDWTSGSIPGAVLTLAFPMMLGNAVRTAYDLIDLAFLGALEEASAAQAAVGMSMHVMFPLFTILMGIGTAATAMVARAMGAGDRERADLVAAQSLLLAFTAAVVVSAVGFILAPRLLTLLGASRLGGAAAGGDVLELATVYLRIMLLGILVMFPVFAAAGILRGAGDAVTPLVISLVGVLVNIPLDWIMIFGKLGCPRLGVTGAAVASVTSQALVFAVGFYVLASGRTRVRLRIRAFRPRLDVMRQVIVIGVPSSVQMTIRSVMAAVIMMIVSRFGTAVVAAYALVMRLHHAGFMPTFGIAAASATLVGQNLGAGKPDRAHRSAVVSTALAVAVMGAAAVLSSALAPRLVALFNQEPGVIAAGTAQMRVTALGLVFAALGIVFGRSVNGAGETVVPMVFTLASLWGLQMPLAWFLAGMPSVGEFGVYWAYVAAGALNAVLITAYFYLGRWKEKRV